jgi:hypothetical protein
MRAYELITLTESYYDELMNAVRDVLLISKPEDGKTLDVMKFRRDLAATGYNLSDSDLKDVINSSNFANLSGNKIQYTDEVPVDLTAQGAGSEQDAGEVVSDLAQGQAMKDVKA